MGHQARLQPDKAMRMLTVFKCSTRINGVAYLTSPTRIVDGETFGQRLTALEQIAVLAIVVVNRLLPNRGSVGDRT